MPHTQNVLRTFHIGIPKILVGYYIWNVWNINDRFSGRTMAIFSISFIFLFSHFFSINHWRGKYFLNQWETKIKGRNKLIFYENFHNNKKIAFCSHSAFWMNLINFRLFFSCRGREMGDGGGETYICLCYTDDWKVMAKRMRRKKKSDAKQTGSFTPLTPFNNNN